MVPALTNIVRRSGEPIQASLRQAVVAAVAEGQLLPGSELPPSRVLARQLGVARNTITAVYDDLIERGVLTSISRRGVFVSKQSVVTRSPRNCERPEVDWHTRMKIRPTHQRNAFRPSDWQSYPFPFVYGQVDPALFPLADWRSCSRDALARGAVNWWSADRVTLDDPMLIKQITRHILPRRGITANDDEVLITLGSQQAMYLLARLFIGPDTVVGIEEPGYPDLRNVSTLAGGDVRAIPVDDEGLVIGPELGSVGIVFVSPNHQCPTMVTMSNRRRRALLDWAQSRDAIIIEDDYESDLLHSSEHTPALAAQANGRVLYMGTFSKILAPGMRLGYLGNL